mgnify:CR=1 FL=1
MMKKKYQSPQFYMVEVATQQMLALSKTSKPYDGTTPLLAPELTRRHKNDDDLDDDEEDEEDW